jgi:hypothetical protein
MSGYSHKLLVTPNREFERQVGGKTVLSGLRLAELASNQFEARSDTKMISSGFLVGVLRDSHKMTSSSGLRGHRRTYLTILESADDALFKMVRYVLLRPLRPELDVIQNNCRVRFVGISRYVHFSGFEQKWS